jgi:hypothetical protein
MDDDMVDTIWSLVTAVMRVIFIGWAAGLVLVLFLFWLNNGI